MKSRHLLLIIGGSLFSTMNAMAETGEQVEPPFYITGLTKVQIPTSTRSFDGSKIAKTISLNAVTPSETFKKRQKETFEAESITMAEKNYTKITPFVNKLPYSVDLGMENVPVLDQGQEGTCVTFATTAAMNTLLGRGDFISQQCALDLNNALGNNYWDGAYYASQIIDPLKAHGLVEQSKCPSKYPNRWSFTSVWWYESLADKEVKADAISYQYTNSITLDAVKTALKNKHRVAIGFGLVPTQDPISVQGFNVKIGLRTTTGGLWACKQTSSPTNFCGSPTAGHEVVIIGFDDKQQLLKIRNSWNTQVGDNGDFYMTYTFFNTMNGDGTEIFKTTVADAPNNEVAVKKSKTKRVVALEKDKE